MASPQQRPKIWTQVVLSLAVLGAIAPGCIAFATAPPKASDLPAPAAVSHP